jgi:uncharacterized damage-inducible protein DinB
MQDGTHEKRVQCGWFGFFRLLSSVSVAIKDALLPEFDHEMGTTRRLLERTPADKLAWKPHEKSMSLGQLAGHLANIPHWMEAILQQTVFDVAAAGVDARPRLPESVAWLLSDFDAKVKTARAGLANTGDADLLTPWTFKQGPHEVFTMPRIAAIRSFVMNHSIHHRGQLSVYLRLNDIPVPPMYGPTADEQ